MTWVGGMYRSLGDARGGVVRGGRCPEHVRSDRGAGIQPDDARERPAVVEPVLLPDLAEARIVQVEEPVAVPQRLELLLPDRELELAELRARDVLLRDHSDERVELVWASVDRLETGGKGRPAGADDRVLLGAVASQRDGVPIGITQLDEVQDVGIVDRHPAREAVGSPLR